MIQTVPLSPPTIPPLENGDRLTRKEFERRYSAMPQLKKAELIEGLVYMGSPLRITQHGEPHASIMVLLGLYRASTPGVQLGDNCTVRLDAENEPQPDALLRIQWGGQSIVDEDGYVEGAPELMVEIAASSVSIDLHKKRDVYQSNRVQEYIVWRVNDRALEWFCLQDDRYVDLLPDPETGFLCSRVFPGLWLDRQALLRGDLVGAIATLQQGLATAEHEAFVQQLATRNRLK